MNRICKNIRNDSLKPIWVYISTEIGRRIKQIGCKKYSKRNRDHSMVSFFKVERVFSNEWVL